MKVPGHAVFFSLLLAGLAAPAATNFGTLDEPAYVGLSSGPSRLRALADSQR